MNKIRTFNLSTEREIKYRYHDAAKVVFVFDLVPTIFSFLIILKKILCYFLVHMNQTSRTQTKDKVGIMVTVVNMVQVLAMLD